MPKLVFYCQLAVESTSFFAELLRFYCAFYSVGLEFYFLEAVLLEIFK